MNNHTEKKPLPDDAWGIVKSYLFHSKFEAENLIKYHSEIPYSLGLHNHKGEANILNKLPVSASGLYAKNVFNFVDNLFDKENKKININLEDEIILKTLIK